MRKSLTLVVLLSVLAGCSVPMPAAMPTTASLPQAARQMAPAAPSNEVRVPVVATGVQQPIVAKQAATAPKAGKVLVTKVEPDNVKAPAALTLPKVSAGDKVLTSLNDFDPMKVMAQLGPNQATAPDDPDDDIDDDEGSFSTKWLWGWGGIDGRDRGLRTFSKEESRAIEWLLYPTGWTCMRAALTPAEEPGAIALAMSPLYNRTQTNYKFLPDGLKSRTKRHLKFFRRQDVFNLKSKHLGYYQIQKIGQTAIAGYIARAEYGAESYIAYYDGAGKFLWAYGTNYGGYSGYGGQVPLPQIAASPSAGN
jgi:hypothetical protein